MFGDAKATAKALGYTGADIIYNWPEVLSMGVSDRVRGAAWRMGLLTAPAATPDATPPAPRPAKRRTGRSWLVHSGRAA